MSFRSRSDTAVRYALPMAVVAIGIRAPMSRLSVIAAETANRIDINHREPIAAAKADQALAELSQLLASADARACWMSSFDSMALAKLKVAVPRLYLALSST